MIMFLNGIVPDSGSLAIPVIDEFYQDWYSMFPASQFRFDYETRTIRIPVWTGKINFTFGTETASYDFPDNATYEVQFSSDWNNITGATKISSLNGTFSYLPPRETERLPDPTPTPFPPPQFQPAFPTIRLQSLPDTRVPTIKVVSPKNETYSVADIPLLFNLSESASWIRYSIDDGAEVEVSGEETLLRLPDGAHSIVVYAGDSAGNVGASEKIHFTVEKSPLTIGGLSPQNQTYTTTELLLDVTLNETASWTGYSLDGKENVTFTGNLSLSGLTYGSHSITVYANDTYGNMITSDPVYFTVPEPFPVFWVAASTVILAGGSVAFLLYRRQSRKATKKPRLKESMSSS